MKTTTVLTFLAIFVGTVFARVEAGVITFQDATLSDSEWDAQLGFVNASSASFSDGNVAAGGSPGAYRQTTHNWTGPGGLNVLHLNSSAIYDPSISGAITEIDYSFDLSWVNAPFGPGAVAYRLLILQNGTYYASSIQLTTQNAWQTRGETGLTALDFNRHQLIGLGGANPDFSGSANPLQFGYLSGNGTSFNESVTTVSGIDNWSTTIRSADAVPEPSSCLGFILLSLAGCLRRRRT